MRKSQPPIGKSGHRRGPVVDHYIEEKMERVKRAKRFVEFKITPRGEMGYLVVHYIVEDQHGNETLIKQRITSGDPAELETFQQRLVEMYLDPIE